MTRHSTSTPRSLARSSFLGALLPSALAVAIGCGGAPEPGGPAAVGESSSALSIDQSVLPRQFRTSWDPGIPGGIPRDDDPVRPASVWLPPGNPYGGYSVNPALTGVGNAAAFTAAAQAAINAAGSAASSGRRQVVRLKAGTYYVNPQQLPNKGGRVGLYVTADNVTLRGEGPDSTRLVANGTIPEYGTVVLFGHRTGFSDADFRVVPVTGNAWMWTNTVPVADATKFAVGDVITIDMLDGPAKAVGAVQFNGEFMWFYDAQYFKRQPRSPGLVRAPELRASTSSTWPAPTPQR